MGKYRNMGLNRVASRTGRRTTLTGASPFERLEERRLCSTTAFGGTIDAGGRNGAAVAVLGNNLVSSAPWASVNGVMTGIIHLYNSSTGTLIRNFTVPSAGSGALLGTALATTNDGLIIAGANGNAGAVYVFDSNTGSLVLTLTNPSKKSGENFGMSVAVVDGNILVGAPTASNGTWSKDGSAYLFDRSGNVLAKYTSPNPATTGEFGYSLTSFEDGNIAIGAYYDTSSGAKAGRVYEFDGTSRGTSPAPIVTITDPSPVSDDHFGCSLAAFGSTLLIGADGVDTAGLNNGAAFKFDESGTLQASFYDPTPTTGDAFGHSVDINASHILIGAYSADTGSTSNTGRAYVFDPTSNALTATLNSPSTYTNGAFGDSVILNGDTAFIGSYQSGQYGTNAGIVYEINL